jgi:hypothetical protein
MHELGEEVYRTHSPNIVGAWIHFPQRLVQKSRGFPYRTVQVIMYPWWRTAQIIQQLGDPPNELVALLTDTLGVRLNFYINDLQTALDYSLRQSTIVLDDGESINSQLVDEARTLRRVMARLFSAVSPSKLDVLRKLWGRIPLRDDDSEGHLWLRCGRHILADYEDGRIPGSVKVGPKWSVVREAFVGATGGRSGLGINGLHSAFTTLVRHDDEKREQSAYQTFAQMINLTWEEQMEVAAGLDASPGRDPTRDLERVVLVLAVELLLVDSKNDASRPASDWLFDFLVGERDRPDIVQTAHFNSLVAIGSKPSSLQDEIGAQIRKLALRYIDEQCEIQKLKGVVNLAEDGVNALLMEYHDDTDGRVTNHSVLVGCVSTLLARAQREPKDHSGHVTIGRREVWSWLTEARSSASGPSA